jgi:propionate CoA-transferase
MRANILSASEAVKKIKDNQTVCIGGAGAGHVVPDSILKALGLRYRNSGSPRNLKIIHPCGIGDNDQRGLNHIAQEGLIETDIGGFWGNAPKMVELAQQQKIKGYNFPQGVLTHLIRATAGGEKGMLTKTGLHTFVDPRYEGGKINNATIEDIVEVVNIRDEEFLFYHTHPIDVAIIRGSSIDAEGNITMEQEVGTFSMLSMAQAAKVNNGIVIAQVKQFNQHSNAKPAVVKVPGVLIDYVVIEPSQPMTFITPNVNALVNRNAAYQHEHMKLDGIKKVIARRAALELKAGDFVNLGYGMPDGVPIVVQNSGLLNDIIFMIEQGQIDGVITTGLNFGAMYNPSAIIDDGYQFDQFHGGILDICFLGFAQVDSQGKVNSSRFGKIITGCGGFIDISQNTRKVVFCGSFAAKSDISVNEKGLHIHNPGKFKKFVSEVEQITFNGIRSKEKKQDVLFITERAIFKLSESGVELTEMAPGVDLDKDILPFMEFKPIISPDLRQMPEFIFKDEFRLKLKN